MRADAAENEAVIVAAAARVWANQLDASFDDIAQEAGVGRATVFRRFASREALLSAVRVHAAEESLKALDANAAASTSAHGAVVMAISSLSRLARRYRSVYLSAEGDRPIPEYAELRARLEQLFSLAQREGALRTDLPAAWLVSVFASHLSLIARSTSLEAEAFAATTLLDGISSR